MATPLTQPHQQLLFTQSPLRSPLFKLLFTFILCSIFFIFGSYNSTTSSFTSTNSSAQLHLPNSFCLQINTTHRNPTISLDFASHHSLSLPQESSKSLKPFFLCPKNFTNYTPCHDPFREMQFSTQQVLHKERHCPQDQESIRCLIPSPAGYRKPIPWPKSRDSIWFKNVPYPRLTEYKKSQNWVKLEGDRLVFPGGGTSFPSGVKGYVDEIRRVVPLKSGNIRTVLDTGCGVASFGAALMDYNILTMSLAPRDNHESQVQFALERGLPAMLGVLGTYRLPFPSRSFDMAHCARCLVQWTGYDGLCLLEIDRVLRPGGYWVLSGPPINWKIFYKGWERQAVDLQKEQNDLEDLARRLCWKKVSESNRIAVWRKPTNHVHCIKKIKTWKSPRFCADNNPDAGWYEKMNACITPLPKVSDVHDVAGGALEKWPKRLNAVPPRIKSGKTEGTSIKAFKEDYQLWEKRLSHYKLILKSLFTSKYRNIMDMNAGFGGFAAALSKSPVWVMNVVPSDTKNNTLGIIYERGLIGTYMNWCEAFSTYPRTYDLLHASGVFSMYMDKCDIQDILLEMYRILRPGGAVIIRDHIDVIVKVIDIMERMRWKGKISHSERGPFHPEKVLVVDNSE
ncbi:putative S-adenosyl-L-methionine-dependent methyltransferase [Dillenia turbinata]|uniref:Methyltransferase n=1 Tax=Dillenia turbinata TaxID=194707 RepID=A0AAN8VIL8_9MAGN